MAPLSDHTVSRKTTGWIKPATPETSHARSSIGGLRTDQLLRVWLGRDRTPDRFARWAEGYGKALSCRAS